MEQFTPDKMLQRAQTLKEAKELAIETQRKERHDKLYTALEAYLMQTMQSDWFELPIHISCYHNTERGPKLATTPGELQPVLEALLLKLNTTDPTSSKEYYISKVQPSHECDCDHCYCGHAGAVFMNVRDKSFTK